MAVDADALKTRLAQASTVVAAGRVMAVTGLSLRFAMPGARVGDVVHVKRRGEPLAAFDLAGLLMGLATSALKHDFLPNDLIPSLLLQGIGYGLFMTPILNAVLSGIQDHLVGAAAGVLTTMQRGGNAIGMAVLEIPFAVSLDHARVAGLSNATAYVAAFMAVSACIVVMILVVITLLFRLPLAPPATPATGR